MNQKALGKPFDRNTEAVDKSISFSKTHEKIKISVLK